jgi:hypothetical protein
MAGSQHVNTILNYLRNHTICIHKIFLVGATTIEENIAMQSLSWACYTIIDDIGCCDIDHQELYDDIGNKWDIPRRLENNSPSPR